MVTANAENIRDASGIKIIPVVFRCIRMSEKRKYLQMKFTAPSFLASLALVGSFLLAAESTEKEEANAGTTRDPKLTELLHNEDCFNFFDHRNFPEGKAGEMVNSYVDVLAGAGVSVPMCKYRLAAHELPQCGVGSFLGWIRSQWPG